MRLSEATRPPTRLLKRIAVSYDRKGRDAFIDDMVHAYSKDAIAAVGEGASSLPSNRYLS